MSLKMNEILRLFKELVWSFGGVSRGVSTMSCLGNIPPADGPTGSHKLHVNRNFQRGSFKMLYKTHFDHNFSRPARIELKFCTVAKLEELNNFCLDQNEGYPWKKVRFRDLRLYLARALLFLTVHSFEIDQSKWSDASLFSLKSNMWTRQKAKVKS